MTTPALRRMHHAAALAAGLALALSGLVAPAAFGATPPTTADTGSITIHKFQNPDVATGLGHTGAELAGGATAGLTPLAGITFQVQQVNTIDLSTNAGWAAANALATTFNPADLTGFPGGSYTLGTALSQTTAMNAAKTDATAVFAGLPIGVYLVQETGYSAAVTPAAPFLVTVPITDPVNLDRWIYDVHVYPKNSVDALTKTVQDAGVYQVGQNVNWTITADIPNVDALDGYRIADNLDSRLDYVSAAVTVTGTGAPVLTAGTDYTLTPATATTGGPLVVVDFTAAGRAKLVTDEAAAVQVVITTRVASVGDGNIVNQAVLYPNAEHLNWQPGEPGQAMINTDDPTCTVACPAAPSLPTTPLTTGSKWGSVDVLKHAQGNDAQTLSGATFKVWAEVVDPADSAKTVKLPVSVDGASTWTTNSSGQLSISGLRYSQFANGAPVAAGNFGGGYIRYWLEETQAPSGYTLLTEQIPFEVNDVDAAVDVSIANVPANAGFILPLTGGSGVKLLYGAGALILGGALILTVRARRRSTTR